MEGGRGGGGVQSSAARLFIAVSGVVVLRVKGSEGLVDVEGNTVGIGRKLGVYWVSKVAEATVGPQRGEQTSNMSGTL